MIAFRSCGHFDKPVAFLLTLNKRFSLGLCAEKSTTLNVVPGIDI